MVEKTRLISVKGNKVLVLKKLTSKKSYTLAGGVKKKKETHIQSLIRETFEEIDVLLKEDELTYLCSSYVKKDIDVKDTSKHYFVTRKEIRKVKNKEPEKFKAILWIEWEKVLGFLDKSDKKAIEFYFKEKKVKEVNK